MLVLALAGGALYTWALVSTDSSGFARAMVWRDADVYDVDRFPARAVAAPTTPSPLPDCEVQRTGEDLLGDLLEQTRTRGLLVLREGCVVTEWYGAGADSDTLLTSFSVAKSVLATLVGIALERGELGSLDEPVTEHLPELAERDPRFEAVTLRHLMAMESGLRYEEAGLPWSDDALTYYGTDLRELALSAEVVDDPATRWLYNNYNPLLVGMVLERATGTTVAAYAEEHLWSAVGAEQDASWSIDSEESGFEKMESGYNAVLRDWGRFGLMAVDGAAAEAAGTSPDAAFWRAATQPTAGDAVSPHYGLWWWLDEDRPGAFLARGNKGQFVYVDPRAEVVVARFGEDFGIENWPDVLARTAEQVAGPVD